MTNSQAAKIILSAINARAASIAKTYHICDWEGKLQCMPHRHTGKPHRIFWKGLDSTLRIGFTAEEWESLFKQIIEFYPEVTK